jgi:hypothetical protein
MIKTGPALAAEGRTLLLRVSPAAAWPSIRSAHQRSRLVGLTRVGPALNIVKSACRIAPSFNGRTAASGAAYRGSNPWGATSCALPGTFRNFLVHSNTLSIQWFKASWRRLAVLLRDQLQDQLRPPALLSFTTKGPITSSVEELEWRSEETGEPADEPRGSLLPRDSVH